MPAELIVVPLDEDTLSRVAERASTPTYDRQALTPSIVHIGVGGFHRAHLATYVDELCEAGQTQWGIVGSGILPADHAMAQVLEAQDGLYTLITRGPDHTDVRVIGSIVHYIHAAPAPELLAEQIAAPATQIVSLTVTEGGYPIDDVTGDFLLDSPIGGPGSTFAIIAAGLELRRTSSGGPLTILSCDNIMANGHAARNATLGEAARVSPDLVRWIEESVSFPNSMVDRITPATADADRVWLQEQHGIEDLWPVVTEPFRQWIIEDRFAGQRLPLEELDVIVTNDVEPYEHMKLRLLNAGHSCLAYLAALDGIVTVDAAMADPHIRRFVRSFLHAEAKPVVPAVAGIDVDEYIESLIERFSNPNIGDQIARLCLDGSAKFPKFLLPTVRAQLAAGGPTNLSALALAGWCQYLLGAALDGAAIERAADPLLELGKQHAAASQSDPKAFLDFAEVFDRDIVEHVDFRGCFERHLSRLRSEGLRSAIDTALQETETFHDRSSD